MISKSENQKKFLETRNENIEPESTPSVSKSLIEGFVCLQEVGQKADFVFWTLIFHDSR